MRKLLDFPTLGSLSVVNEFKHGGLHPGYAFPLWHATLALITKLAGADPAQTVRNVSALLVPLAFVVSYAAGRALFRSVWGGIAGLVAQFALIGLAPEHTGTLRSLSQPGVAARQLLVPALLALVFTYMRDRRMTLSARWARVRWRWRSSIRRTPSSCACRSPASSSPAC